jgi:hypothetical protein
MKIEDTVFWNAFKNRNDLIKYNENALLLFALQLRFNIEDIETVAAESLTGSFDDKKVDLIYIDAEAGYAVIAQTYISQRTDKSEAPANKGSDLNTAITWLINQPIKEIPEHLRTHAEALREVIKKEEINKIHIWYLHNLPESRNVEKELSAVEQSANAAVHQSIGISNIEIHSKEIGINSIQDWYKSITSPILIDDRFDIKVEGGYEITGLNWTAFVTSIPIIWFYDKFNQYKAVKLFSANIRDYLGSRKDDANINNGIKDTASMEPNKFWVYNNGITALVHKYDYNEDDKLLTINGLSIINGAQTTGAIGHLTNAPDKKASVHVRFITCTDQKTLTNIVKFNNSQNKIMAPDFRSKDNVQIKLNDEFKTIPDVVYVPRRGGHDDIIRRVQNGLYSITAGQALAAFHNKPHIAYHGKTKLWEDDSIYVKYFNEHTTATHIVFAYSLLLSVERKKNELREKFKTENLFDIEEKQYAFLKKRGSMYLLIAGISKALEIILNKRVPNRFKVNFIKNISPNQGAEKWNPIVEVCAPFMNELTSGLADGFKSEEQVNNATDNFASYLASTKEVNKPIYTKFSDEVV